MKMLLFKMGFVVVVLLAVPYFMMGGGKMPAFLDGMFDQMAKTAKLPENITSVVTDTDVTVYKWVDDQGVTHFSGVKPMNQLSETKHLKTNINIMQAVKIPDIKEGAKKIFGGLISLGRNDNAKTGEKSSSEPYQMENPYTPEGLQNLIQGAQNVEGLINQRSDAQKSALGR